MISSLKNAWATNKLKVLMVAVPVVLLLLAAIFLKGYRKYLISSAQKLLEGSKKKDEQLKAEAEEANKKANEHKAKADEIAGKIDDANKDDDADWHKKQG